MIMSSRDDDINFTEGMKIEPKIEMSVQPSEKKRVKKTAEEKAELLDNPDKVRPFITVAKKKKATKDEYYIDPHEFAACIKEYYETEDDKCANYEKLGKFFLKLAKRMITASSFARYSWKEDMIGEALIKMTKALRNKKYSFEFGSSPFSYYSQIAYWSFCAVIKSEKKQAEIARKYREEKFAEMFRECEDENSKNVYIRPDSDGEIFHEGSFESYEE